MHFIHKFLFSFFTFIIFINFNFALANDKSSTTNFEINYKDFENKTIKEIKFNGLLHISPLLASELMRINVGDKINSKALSNGILNLFSQGYFEDIWIAFDNGLLTINVREKPRIASITIKGYGNENERKTLLSQLNLRKGDTFDELKLASTKEAIVNFLQMQGYYGTVVEEDLEEVSNDGAYAITLNVNRGNEILIRQAEYIGRKKLSLKKVESLSANKKRTPVLGWMWGFNNGKLHLNELEYDPLRIKDVYMRNGFLDADISSPFLVANFYDYNATLRYTIKEGDQYKISNIKFELTKDVIPIKTLQRKIKVKKGKIFDIQKLREDSETLKLAVADLGYAYVQVNPDIVKNEDNNTVEVVYYIDPGQKVKISDVIISGNVRTQDRIIRREILLAPGNYYNLKEIIRSENALRRLGYFESVQIDQRRTSTDTMELIVNVKEGKTGELLFGLGYGSYDGFMVNASASERNIFGTGQSGSIYLNISKLKQTYNLSLTNPRIFDTRFSTTANIFNQQFDNYDYTESSLGFGLSVGRSLTDSLNVALAYGFSNTFVSKFSNYAYEPYFPKKAIVRSNLTPSINFDNTDDYYFPKNGVIASASVEYNGLGGDVRYTKLYGKVALYYYFKNIVSWLDLIARYKAQAGHIINNGYTPITDTFYMGGVNSVRGFKAASISPRSLNGVRVGGDTLFTNSIELSYGLIPAAQMRFSIWYDFGILENHDLPYPILDSERRLQRSSWGLALEWVSPIGPLVLVFPIQVFGATKDSDTSKFEFTMGTRF